MRFTNVHSAHRTQIVILAAIMLLSAIPSWGQYRRRRGGLADGDHFHFGYVSGHVGYSILDTRATGVMPAGSVGGGVGIGYEYRNSGLWANIGVQYSMHRSSLKLDPYVIEHKGYMRDGAMKRNGMFLYDVEQTDLIEWNFIDVPILFGYYTHGFHIGAGLKLSYAINANSRTKGTYNLRFKPSDYQIDAYENMPERGLTVYEFENVQPNRLNINCGLIGEIGYDLLSSAPAYGSICHVLKLSFYFEYGLNNSNKGGDKQRFELPAPDDKGEAKAKDVVFNPYLNTEASPVRTVPFFAGAKLTYMIGGSRTARSGFHHGCMCYN